MQTPNWRERAEQLYELNEVGQKGRADFESLCIQVEKESIERAIEVVEKTQKEFTDMPISYDQNVDITELPDGLGIEMTGMLKGLQVGFEQSIQALKTLLH